MSDPVISSIAAVVAGKAAEAAVQGGKSACAALVRLVRERFGRDKEATTALETARSNPENTAAVAGLALVLERLVLADAEFGAQIRKLRAACISATYAAQASGDKASSDLRHPGTRLTSTATFLSARLRPIHP
jgi:hypothetical protein